jgi:hypothetical protein
MKFAIDDSENEENEDCDNSDGNQPIRSHPNSDMSVTQILEDNRPKKGHIVMGYNTYEPSPSTS